MRLARLLRTAAAAAIVPFPIGLPSPSSPSVTQAGIFQSAPVSLDGAVLFRIAAQAKPGASKTALQLRENSIEGSLTQLVASAPKGGTIYDPRTIKVDEQTADGQTYLVAGDARHARVPILTVTTDDAKYNQSAVAVLAQRWGAVLQTALRQALRKRQPAVERRSTADVVRVGVLLILGTLLLAALVGMLRRRIGILERSAAKRGTRVEEAQSQPVSSPAPSHGRRRRFLLLAVSAIDPAQRAAFDRAIAALLLWIVVLAWFAGLVWGFSLFAQTTPIAHAILRAAVSVAGIWIVAGLVNRLLDLIIPRLAAQWSRQHTATPDERARQLLRIPTVSHALSGFKAWIIVFIALLASLGQIGLPVGSVVTVGGVVAIAVTFAAQNFVRDFLNGFLVLFEDQYVVGDYITINGQTGIVEQLNLRMVQLRDNAGNLTTIPHSSVTTAINHSRNWSRVDYRVSVDAGADVTKAMKLVRAAIEAVGTSGEWRGAMLEPVEWIGVESMSRDGIVLRASVKTAPLRQYELRRAINERVREAFAGAGIRYGAPLPEIV